MGQPLKAGDVVDGTYVVERLLGAGGMGAVYVAREERLARRVAIKVLLASSADDPGAHARFEREALASAALQSDHAARVFNVGRLASGTPFIVMELLEGEDLAQLLARRGTLAAEEVVSFMLQICDALVEAHALGIVHRDLKPANVFLARRPTGATTVKVLDFGISKGANVTPSPLTGTAMMVGTPLYMSPEQLRRASAVDGRTDVWSLGAMMYELLTGRPPFVAAALPDLCALILDAAPAPIATRRPDVPAALAALVHRCLEKDRDKRFATARELMTALAASMSPSHRDLQLAKTEAFVPPAKPSSPQMMTEPLAQPVPIPAPSGPGPGPGPATVPVAAPMVAPVYAATADPVSMTAHGTQRRSGLVAAGVAFGVALIVGGVVFYSIASPTSPAPGTEKVATSAPLPVREPPAPPPASVAWVEAPSPSSTPSASAASAKPPQPRSVQTSVVTSAAPVSPRVITSTTTSHPGSLMPDRRE